MAEALLRDTDAISKGTVEFGGYRGKILVRFRSLEGSVVRRLFPYAESEEAFAFFQECVEKLRVEAAARYQAMLAQGPMEGE